MEMYLSNLPISALACLAGILLYGSWTILDLSIAGPNRIGELLRNEIMATLAGIGICILSFSVLVFDEGWVGRVASSAMGVFAVITHLFLEPQEASFWGRKRIRKAFLLVLVVITFALTYLTPKPWLIPVLFATFIYHRHRQCMLHSMSTSLTDLESVKTKLLSHEAELRNLQQLQNGNPQGQPAFPSNLHSIDKKAS